jgi:hypothetical protein
MHRNYNFRIVLLFLSLALVVPACSTFAPTAAPTDTPQPTATNTLVPTATLTPTRTPRPTATPNLAATQKAEDFQAEVQSYFDQGYLASAKGSMKEFDDFSYEWAQLGWYDMNVLPVQASDFFISSHVRWSSAYKNADVSGCGYVFSLQENGDHYAIFLDRSKILFLITSDQYGRTAGPTRGTGTVKFDNPFDKPAEADFTVIVNDNYVYALVDGELIGEYTLAQSRGYEGYVALTLLSGTNKDFGTRCDMTDIHLWTPK